MSVETKELHFSTQGEVEIIDITEKVNRTLSESAIKDGIVTIFVPGLDRSGNDHRIRVWTVEGFTQCIGAVVP